MLGRRPARWLAARDVRVVEVDRQNRQARRRRGKSDTIDAEEAARAVVAGRARTIPKTGTGPAEMVRMLRVARRSAIKQHTQALLQLQALADTAPDDLRDRFKKLRYAQLIATRARFRTGELTTPRAAARFAMASLGRRLQALARETAALDEQLKTLTRQVAPALLERHGASAPRPPTPCSLPPATIPSGLEANSLSQRSAAPRRSRPRPATPTATDSTEAETAKPTARSGASS